MSEQAISCAPSIWTLITGRSHCCCCEPNWCCCSCFCYCCYYCCHLDLAADVNETDAAEQCPCYCCCCCSYSTLAWASTLNRVCKCIKLQLVLLRYYIVDSNLKLFASMHCIATYLSNNDTMVSCVEHLSVSKNEWKGWNLSKMHSAPHVTKRSVMNRL